MKYLIVDVYALAYRALYGYPDLTNRAGEPTSVIVGFFKQFISRVSDIDSYYPIFVADSGSVRRKEMYPEYKANRQKREDSFYTQIDKVLELGSLIGNVYRVDGWEADDLCASFIQQHVAPTDYCLLLTVDADWLQLLSRNVDVLQLKTNQVHIKWTDELFLKEWGFLPAQIVDFKAIVGDGSDNIGGVRGVGDKTATELIKNFQSIENIYANIIKVPNKRKLQEHLIENEELVRRNKKLVQLERNIELPAPGTQITQETIGTFIDKFQGWTDSVELTNILGVYLQKLKQR